MSSDRPNLWLLGFSAVQFGFMVVAGLLGGSALDKRFGTGPILGFVGIGLGFAAGIVLLVRILKRPTSGGAP